MFHALGPNGEVRQILGDFRVSDLLRSRGGKVMVGTDENEGQMKDQLLFLVSTLETWQ